MTGLCNHDVCIISKELEEFGHYVQMVATYSKLIIEKRRKSNSFQSKSSIEQHVIHWCEKALTKRPAAPDYMVVVASGHHSHTDSRDPPVPLPTSRSFHKHQHTPTPWSHLHLHKRTHTYTRTHTHTHAQTHTHTHIYTHTHTHAHKNTHAHAHTHTHMCAHACALVPYLLVTLDFYSSRSLPK